MSFPRAPVTSAGVPMNRAYRLWSLLALSLLICLLAP